MYITYCFKHILEATTQDMTIVKFVRKTINLAAYKRCDVKSSEITKREISFGKKKCNVYC